MDSNDDIPAEYAESLSQLRLEDLERRARQSGGSALSLREWVALAEAWRIAQALRDCRGNRSAAARALGIGRRTLYTKLEKLGLVPEWVRVPGRATNSVPATPVAASFGSERD